MWWRMNRFQSLSDSTVPWIPGIVAGSVSVAVNDLLYKQKFQMPKRQTYLSDFFKSQLFLLYYYFNLKSFIVCCATFD